MEKGKRSSVGVKKRILIVDDEKGWLDLLSYELTDQGYDVVAVTNGEDAIRKSSGEIFDLIVSDFKMPKMDGIETLHSIRKVQPNSKLVLMTAYIFESKIQNELSSHNIICLTKPLIVGNLIPVIRNFLNND